MELNSETSFLSTSYWQQINFFKNVTPDVLKEILYDSDVITVGPKKIIFYEDEPAENFGFVIEGVFKLFRTDSLGRRAVTDFLAAGEMVAAMLMESKNSIYPVSVQSVTAGRFLRIPKQTYQNYWTHRPEIIKKIQSASIVRIQSLLDARETQRLSLEQRIAFVIIKQLAKVSVKNGLLKVYFSRGDIADAVGAASESIIRVFSQWTKDGMIELKGDDEFINLALISKKFLQSI